MIHDSTRGISTNGSKKVLFPNVYLSHQSIVRFHMRYDQICVTMNNEVLGNYFGEIPKDRGAVKYMFGVDYEKGCSATLLQNQYDVPNPILTEKEKELALAKKKKEEELKAIQLAIEKEKAEKQLALQKQQQALK